MHEYVVAMKSGHSFLVQVKDFASFVLDLQNAIDPKAINNFYSEGGIMFNINDLSAIYPLPARYEAQSKA